MHAYGLHIISKVLAIDTYTALMSSLSTLQAVAASCCKLLLAVVSCCKMLAAAAIAPDSTSTAANLFIHNAF